MAWKETLYERPLRRPLDDPARAAIEAEYRRRRGEIPLQTDFAWHPTRPELTIRSSMITFNVEFTDGPHLIVTAEMGFAAKMLATQKNRDDAARFVDSILTDLGL